MRCVNQQTWRSNWGATGVIATNLMFGFVWRQGIPQWWFHLGKMFLNQWTHWRPIVLTCQRAGLATTLGRNTAAIHCGFARQPSQPSSTAGKCWAYFSRLTMRSTMRSGLSDLAEPLLERRTTCAPCWSLGTHLGSASKDIGSLKPPALGRRVPVLSVLNPWVTKGGPHTHCVHLPSASISQETVASVLTWATFELAKNPRIAQKVKEEVPTSPAVPATPVPTRKKWWFPQFQTVFYVEILRYHRETEKLLVFSASSNQLPTHTLTQNQGKEDLQTCFLPFV